jgi:GNAT superfamily N-acetyltransferase
MLYTCKDGKQIQAGRLTSVDFTDLEIYLQQLGPETRQRFGPHRFDLPSIKHQFTKAGDYLGYIARDPETGNIIAYSILKKGFLEHDKDRLQAYGLTLNNDTDYTFAPSVSDALQGKGLGQRLFQHICTEIKLLGARRIILWGGVQCSNVKAVHYYIKNGFRVIGMFEHSGWNYDMIKENLYIQENSDAGEGQGAWSIGQ